MSEKKEEAKVTSPLDKISKLANPARFSMISNSRDEFCIYSYRADNETYAEVASKGYFNLCHTFLKDGDTIRVYLYTYEGKLINYVEYLVAAVDKIHKEVTVATLNNVSVEKRLID